MSLFIKIDVKQKFTIYIEPLIGEKNYELWFIKLEALLVKKNLSEYITDPNIN